MYVRNTGLQALAISEARIYTDLIFFPRRGIMDSYQHLTVFNYVVLPSKIEVRYSSHTLNARNVEYARLIREKIFLACGLRFLGY